MTDDPSPPPPAAGWLQPRGTLLAARLAFLSITLWIVGTMLLHATGPHGLFALLDLPFNLVCHRMPERTLVLFGVPMPICSRCAGIWLGLSISAFFAWPRVTIPVLRWVFPTALFLMAVEVVTQDLGIHPVFHPTRVLTGLLVSMPFGGAIGTVMRKELGGASW